MTYEYVRSEGKAKRMGSKLMAIVAEGERGRIYLSPAVEQEDIAHTAKPYWKPETQLPDNPRNFNTPLYGLCTFGDIFAPRQLVALTTFSDLVSEAVERVREDAEAAGLAEDSVALREGGGGCSRLRRCLSCLILP